MQIVNRNILYLRHTQILGLSGDLVLVHHTHHSWRSQNRLQICPVLQRRSQILAYEDVDAQVPTYVPLRIRLHFQIGLKRF